jgi:hypothetical protein
MRVPPLLPVSQSDMSDWRSNGQPYLNSQNGKVLPNYTLFGFWRNFTLIFTA